MITTTDSTSAPSLITTTDSTSAINRLTTKSISTVYSQFSTKYNDVNNFHLNGIILRGLFYWRVDFYVYTVPCLYRSVFEPYRICTVPCMYRFCPYCFVSVPYRVGKLVYNRGDPNPKNWSKFFLSIHINIGRAHQYHLEKLIKLRCFINLKKKGTDLGPKKPKTHHLYFTHKITPLTKIRTESKKISPKHIFLTNYNHFTMVNLNVNPSALKSFLVIDAFFTNTPVWPKKFPQHFFIHFTLVYTFILHF